MIGEPTLNIDEYRWILLFQYPTVERKTYGNDAVWFFRLFGFEQIESGLIFHVGKKDSSNLESVALRALTIFC